MYIEGDLLPTLFHNDCQGEMNIFGFEFDGGIQIHFLQISLENRQMIDNAITVNLGFNPLND